MKKPLGPHGQAPDTGGTTPAWLALTSAAGCGDGTEVDGDPPSVETTPWLDPTPELRIVTSPDGMRLVGARAALQLGVRVQVVNPRTGESVEGTAKEDGSLSLLVPGGSRDDYDATVRKIVAERREAVLTLAVASLEDTEAAGGPCNCADVSFRAGGTSGIVHQPLECLPGFCAGLDCYPQLDAWQAEICARPGAGAILRRQGCGLVQFDFARGSDLVGAFGNEGNPFYSFDAESQELVGFYRYSDTSSFVRCDLAGVAGWSPGVVVHGRALSFGPNDCSEVSSCVVCGAEAGVDTPACAP